MGGRGSSGTKNSSFGNVFNASPRHLMFSKTVYFDDGIHYPEFYRHKDMPEVLKNVSDVVVQVYNDKTGKRNIEKMKALGFEVVRKNEQGDGAPPQLRNTYYMRRKKRGR